MAKRTKTAVPVEQPPAASVDAVKADPESRDAGRGTAAEVKPPAQRPLKPPIKPAVLVRNAPAKSGRSTSPPDATKPRGLPIVAGESGPTPDAGPARDAAGASPLDVTARDDGAWTLDDVDSASGDSGPAAPAVGFPDIDALDRPPAEGRPTSGEITDFAHDLAVPDTLLPVDPPGDAGYYVPHRDADHGTRDALGADGAPAQPAGEGLAHAEGPDGDAPERLDDLLEDDGQRDQEHDVDGPLADDGAYSDRSGQEDGGDPGWQVADPHAGPSTDAAAEEEPRARHASGVDHKWGWVAGWTLLGTALPGAGLIVAGYRRLGGAILALSVLVPVAAAIFLIRGGAIRGAVAIGTDQETLLLAAAGIIAVGLLLIVLTVYTNRVLMRRTRGGRIVHGVNLALVSLMVAAIGIPTGTGARYLLITRNTLPSVFGEAKPGATRPDGEAKDPWADIPRVNVLLIGSDADDGRDGVRTDSMILASIDTETGDTVLLSPPRNLQRVPFPKGSPAREAWPYGFGNTRGEPWPKTGPACGGACDLSAVWRWGEENAKRYYPDEDNPGATALRSAIEGAFGLEVDAHVVVDLDGFKAVVTALGGLRIDVHQRLPIGGTTSRPITGKWIEKGENQLLDGYKAMWFARSRSTTSDYDRMARQRCVMAALVEQADPVALVRAYPGLAKAAGDNITTDIAAEDLPAWVDLSLKIKDASVRSLPFTDKVISYSHPNYRKIRDLVENALEPPQSEPSATSTGSPATPAPGAGDGEDGDDEKSKASATPEPTATVDPKKPQDVNDVC